MATPASNKPRPQRKDAAKKLDAAAQKVGVKDGKTAANMMGLGKSYDKYYNPSRVAKPVSAPTPKPKSTLQKIGGAVKGAVTGAAKGIDDYASGTNSKGQTVISAPFLAPVTAAVGAIRGGYLGAQGKYTAPKSKDFTSKDYPVSPKVAPDRSNNPTRVTGSGPSMNKAMPAPRNYGGITAQPMPYYPPKDGSGPKAERMPYTPPADGSGPKFEKMPFKPEAPKTGKVKPVPPMKPAPMPAPRKKP
jgi:hypothetical protein